MNKLYILLVLSMSPIFTNNTNPQFVVVSENGLNLRSKPSLNSTIIETIPFLEKVTFLSSETYGCEHISNRFIYNTHYKRIDTIEVIGNWRKVTYNGREGFCMDAFLWPTREKYYEIYQNKSVKTALQFPSNSCFYNLYENPKLKYYGIYFEENKTYRKKVNLEYATTYYENNQLDFGHTTAIISVQNNVKNLFFIFGSENDLDEIEINTLYFNPDPDSNEKLSIKTKNINLEVADGVAKVTKGDKVQIINSDENSFQQFEGVFWIGDLNNDEQEDMIIFYGDKSSQTVLYLGNSNSNNVLFKIAGIYFGGYCC